MSSMKKITEFETAKWLLETRKITASHLPIGHSFIPYDLLIHVYNSQFNDEPLTVKNLFSKLHYSEMGTRSHFNRLTNNGWINLESSNQDSRVKICSPTEKFLSQFDLISSNIQKIIQ